jgi:hypothetical protein
MSFLDRAFDKAMGVLPDLLVGRDPKAALGEPLRPQDYSKVVWGDAAGERTATDGPARHIRIHADEWLKRHRSGGMMPLYQINVRWNKTAA